MSAELASSRGEQGCAEVHIPIKGNEIIAHPLFTTSLDETVRCYEDPEMGVHCGHVYVKYSGRISDMRFRRFKRHKARKLVLLNGDIA